MRRAGARSGSSAPPEGGEDVGTIITITLIIAMIGAGMILIHRLNAQHDERVAAFRYSDALPGIGRPRAARTGDRQNPPDRPLPKAAGKEPDHIAGHYPGVPAPGERGGGT